MSTYTNLTSIMPLRTGWNKYGVQVDFGHYFLFVGRTSGIVKVKKGKGFKEVGTLPEGWTTEKVVEFAGNLYGK